MYCLSVWMKVSFLWDMWLHLSVDCGIYHISLTTLKVLWIKISLFQQLKNCFVAVCFWLLVWIVLWHCCCYEHIISLFPDVKYSYPLISRLNLSWWKEGEFLCHSTICKQLLSTFVTIEPMNHHLGLQKFWKKKEKKSDSPNILVLG